MGLAKDGCQKASALIVMASLMVAALSGCASSSDRRVCFTLQRMGEGSVANRPGGLPTSDEPITLSGGDGLVNVAGDGSQSSVDGCPSGGSYTLHPEGTISCSVHGHYE